MNEDLDFFGTDKEEPTPEEQMASLVAKDQAMRARKAQPAPRRGESPTRGKTYQRSEKTKLRKRIADLVRKRPGFVPTVYAEVLAETGEDFDAVVDEIKRMVFDNLLLKKGERKGTKVWQNVYPPDLQMNGRKVSVSELARSEANVHKLAYNTIRERLLTGLKPEEALAMPATTKGRVAAKVAQAAAPRADSTNEEW